MNDQRATRVRLGQDLQRANSDVDTCVDPLKDSYDALNDLRINLQRSQMLACLCIAALHNRTTLEATIGRSTQAGREAMSLGCTLARLCFGLTAHTQEQLSVLGKRSNRSINRDIQAVSTKMEEDPDFAELVEARISEINNLVLVDEFSGLS